MLLFLEKWGLRLGDAANRRLIDITGGHPLALRILAGVLRGVPSNDAIATIERSAVIDVLDEVDPLRENRLARVLGSYIQHLSVEEVAFLNCFPAFEGAVPYPLVERTLTRAYPGTSINSPLVDRDLRVTVGRLLERRLLAASTGGELSTHPTVREYFARLSRRNGQSLAPIHHDLVDEYLRTATSLPERFEEALPLIVACRHAAACEDWSLFDDIFRRRLMRDFHDHLCDYLGAWEEALSLARLADHSSFPAEATPQPGYYPIVVARCLKHLGRSSESRSKYLESLKLVARSRDPDTAMYVNNFLTLLIWRGELARADRLVEMNMRALSWIIEPWRYRWQVEDGFSTIAYLRLLQGSNDTAAVLHDQSLRAWDGYPEEPPWICDYYPYYQSERVLLADPSGHDDALADINGLLTLADAHGCPESICRGHVQAALVHLDRASQNDDQSELVRARQRLEKARLNSTGMNVPDIAIAHHLTQMKAELTQREMYGVRLDTLALETLVERTEVLIATSGLALATPEVVAARGVLAHLKGAADEAKASYERAISECERQGNALAVNSPRSLVHWLGRQVGLATTMGSTASKIDPISLVGLDLSADWMIAELEELAGAG